MFGIYIGCGRRVAIAESYGSHAVGGTARPLAMHTGRASLGSFPMQGRGDWRYDTDRKRMIERTERNRGPDVRDDSSVPVVIAELPRG